MPGNIEDFSKNGDNMRLISQPSVVAAAFHDGVFQVTRAVHVNVDLMLVQTVA